MIVELGVFFTISCACEMGCIMHISTMNIKIRKQLKKVIKFWSFI